MPQSQESAADPAQPPITQVRERVVYHNDFVTVFDDDVLNHGKPGRFSRVVNGHDGRGAAILVRSATPPRRFALVRVYRYATQAYEWAFVRGRAHGADSTLTAHAELAEELGAEATTLTQLGSVTPDSGVLADIVDLYYATVAGEPSGTADPDEVAAIRWVTAAELLELVNDGTIMDGYTLATITRYALITGELTLR